MKVAIFGTGYVGLSNAILFAQKHEVVAVDIIKSKVDLINQRVSPIADPEIEHFLKNVPLNLLATTDPELACKDADYIIIATPTDYDPETNYFDTTSVEQVIRQTHKLNSEAVQVIKSTIPVGFVDSQKKLGFNPIFVPEFLREGKALYDNLYPSRVVIGETSERAKALATILLGCIHSKNVPVLYTNSKEAEAIKLFSNTYLAMRVAFFNELDSYALTKDLSARQIIEGVGLDPRIGNHYCNPSFGYGGYCLPKDTKQLLANYTGVPQEIIGAIVRSNSQRKKFIADHVVSLNPKTVGIYRLIMKTGSDNFRSSAIQDVIAMIASRDIPIIIYEPTLKDDTFMGCKVTHDFDEFKKDAHIILANRMTKELTEIKEKVFSRDIFNNN